MDVKSELRGAREWLRLICYVPISYSEELSSLLLETGTLGTEEQSVPGNGDGEYTSISAYYGGDISAERRAEIEELISNVPFELSFSWEKIGNENWAENWKQFFPPIQVGELEIVPPWSVGEFEGKGKKLLAINPGMAFGTGHHPTTEGCLILLQKLHLEGKTILDVGTGSGILSLASVLLGAERALGIDIDPASIEAARENAAMNGLEGRTEFHLLSIEKLGGNFDIALANIQLNVLKGLVDHFRRLLPLGGELILSGILDYQVSEITEFYLSEGFEKKDELESEHWSSLLLERVRE